MLKIDKARMAHNYVRNAESKFDRLFIYLENASKFGHGHNVDSADMVDTIRTELKVALQYLDF